MRPDNGNLNVQLTGSEKETLRNYVRQIYRDYIESSSPDNLIFKSDFNEEERKCCERYVLYKIETALNLLGWSFKMNLFSNCTVYCLYNLQYGFNYNN